MYTWLLLAQLSVLLAVPTFLDIPDDDSLQSYLGDSETLSQLAAQLDNIEDMEKRSPYNFGVGKRTPYGFGVGKRAPYNFGVGKRSPYNFGVGKRAPYNFGVGKREFREEGWRKRMPYNFGVGR